MGERTGSRVFQWVWSYVSYWPSKVAYILRADPLDSQLYSHRIVTCSATSMS
ncbi:hypothetical protein CTRU02_206194 [Colletotrichum truncatum]|uniref:Uncharacterized protein n=1 Tax=Colletotrichum truncatum TaxID=5467 RepID=A0ACC3Z653_COLTU